MNKIPNDILEIIKEIIPNIKKDNQVYEQPQLEIPLYEDWSETPKEDMHKIEIEL